MKPAQYKRFFTQTEERIRKAVNGFGVEEAQKRLLREICAEDASYTSAQLRELLKLAFRF